MNLISMVITTYNWPAALKLCLNSVFAQDDPQFEIIIADDGSTSENVAITEAFCTQSPVAIKYVHHADQGFRAGTIRNKAVAASHGEYLLFIDGDCVLLPGFIRKHRQLAETGCFVPGNRVLLSQAFTQEVITQRIPLHQKNGIAFIGYWLSQKINRISALIVLPLGLLRHLQATKWQKAMTCNLGIWKTDFSRVNGFDEHFEGWGFEDSDLVIRLIHTGIRRKEGRFAVPVLHLWHPHNDKSQQRVNYQRLMERLAQPEGIVAEKGLSQYL
ncbi:MAG: glycosyltransferase family 2 protein [Methylococcaceae bacterium]|nr:glycosyltransferase family 2 protein [Methylococcaceae bacterium]